MNVIYTSIPTMDSLWNSQKNFEKDLEMYSEIGVIQTTQEPPPPSIAEYNARIGANRNCSIYDTPGIDDEGIIICSNRGRGRGRGSFKFIRPDIMKTNNNIGNDEDDIKRRLQAVNGIGHCNELIEETYRKKIGKITNKPKYDEFEFSDATELPMDSSSSSRNSSRNSKKLENAVSGNTSPNLGNNNGSWHSGSYPDLNTSDPCVIVDEETIYNPPVQSFPPLGGESSRSSNSGSVRSSRSASAYSPKFLGYSSPVDRSPRREHSPVIQTQNSTSTAPLPLSVIRSLARKEKKIPEQPRATTSTPTGKSPPANGKSPTINAKSPTINAKSPTANGKSPTANGKSPTSSGKSNRTSPRISRMNGNNSNEDNDDFWWNASPRDDWRRRDNSPVRFFNKDWRKDSGKTPVTELCHKNRERT